MQTQTKLMAAGQYDVNITLPFDANKTVTIMDEKAVPVTELPTSWQNIAKGSKEYGLTDPTAYVEMAQLFLYKMRFGDVDLFNKREGLDHLKPAFCQMFGTLAQETLEFYGDDFKIANYPNFADIRADIEANTQTPEIKADRLKVVTIAENLFAEFGYDMPATFYYVHLAPIARDEVCEIRPLRFSEQDKLNARGWDAALHAQKVFPMQMRIQSISSQQGFTWEHGCGCNHGLARVSQAQSAFTYNIRPEMRTTWVRDFIWTMWYEYAFFQFVPVTKYLTGEIIEFTE